MNREASVLIVDDDRDIRDVLQFILEAHGFRVAVAADGGDAWNQISGGSRPALILLDLMMPGMDGEHFLKKLRSSRFASMPVVILSGTSGAEEKARELHASGCLVKPVEIDELLDTVRRFVSTHRQTDVA